MNRVLYFLRNDLRIHDNQVLSAIQDAELLLPVYVFDDSLYADTQSGFPRVGSFRFQFLSETLTELRNAYQALGSDIFFAVGNPIEIVTDLIKQYSIDTVVYTREHTFEETAVESQLKDIVGIDAMQFEQRSLIFPRHLPFERGELPDVFTVFKNEVEKRLHIEEPLSRVKKLPAFPDTLKSTSVPAGEVFGIPFVKQDPRAAIIFRGGETSGLDRLDYYLFKSKAVANYKDTRNGMMGADYSSKLSTWLANGSLSPRMVYGRLKEYESQFGASSSTYWLFYELLWRDYFRFVAMKYGAKLFRKTGVKQYMRSKEAPVNADLLFNQWMSGSTNDQFVNAHMLELRLTGYMSNRGRQNVASYLVHDLGIDWRLGASYFESALTDYDVCSNWGNWAYLAGVGNDPRPDRKFNTTRQAEIYDANGEFRKLWLQ